MDADLKQYLEAMEGRLNQLVSMKIEGVQNGLVEAMRDMQTELLRAFAAASEDETIPLRKM